MSHPQAYHRRLRYPRHLFLTPGWYVHNWWKVEDQNFSCTAKQRESVLPGSLAFLFTDFLQDRNMTTDTGIVSYSSLPACFHSIMHTLHTNQMYFTSKAIVLPRILSLLQTGGQYFDEEQNHLGVPPLHLKQLNYSQYCYDATWTLAYALNQTINGNVCMWMYHVCL